MISHDLDFYSGPARLGGVCCLRFVEFGRVRIRPNLDSKNNLDILGYLDLILSWAEFLLGRTDLVMRSIEFCDSPASLAHGLVRKSWSLSWSTSEANPRVRRCLLPQRVKPNCKFADSVV